MMQDTAPIVSIRKLWTQFGDAVVHQDLNLNIEQGQIVALVGGSGSGKTTLLRQVLGLQSPSRGSVQVFGQETTRADRKQLQQLHSRWGMLFQHGALFSALSALDNVALPLRELRTLPESLIRETALFKLHLVGIEPSDALKRPSDLSGGMIKRVALARALALEPELLLLDEPTAGLDPARSESFVQLIAALHQALGLTVIMVTHDLDTLLGLSTHVAVLADKRVIAFGPPEEVTQVPHPFIEQFFQGARAERARQYRQNAQRSG
jgi:phospholipid/cholesterol/gamma-HCH transport system ATP-binding protein